MTSGEGRPASAKPRSDVPFLAVLVTVLCAYVFLILAMLGADATFTSFEELREALGTREIRYAMKLSGHTSSKYIWRYTEPSREDEERALEDLF